MKIIRKSYNEIEYRLQNAKQHLEAKAKHQQTNASLK